MARRLFWIVLVIVVSYCPEMVVGESEITVNAPFEEVVAYLDASFGTRVTNTIRSVTCRSPVWLSRDTKYRVRTIDYQSASSVTFRAWFHQVGGEENNFKVTMVSDALSRIELERVVKFGVAMRGWEDSERRVLEAIASNLVYGLARVPANAQQACSTPNTTTLPKPRPTPTPPTASSEQKGSYLDIRHSTNSP